MRRPLKPFVTEYKQSNRRNPAPGSEQTTSESERPPPRMFDLASNESEDSYDAAMRAADALFSIPSSRATPDSDDKPAQSQPMSAERQAPNVERTPLPEAAGASDKPGGRILRVLDEAPNPQLLALEAEHAPKRRGRKPGSKNKPKVAISISEAQPAAAPAPVVTAPVTPPVRAVREASLREAQSIPAAVPLAALPVSAMPASRAAPRAEPPRGDKKFAWVRDRLRPGEDWKRRRLPRVCW